MHLTFQLDSTSKINCIYPTLRLRPYLLQPDPGTHWGVRGGFHDNDVIDRDLALKSGHMNHSKQPAQVLRVYLGVHRLHYVWTGKKPSYDLYEDTYIYLILFINFKK